jgi:flagellar biosynthesis protein FlhA
MAGYVVADPASVIITHFTEVVKQYAHELITRQEVQALVDNAKEQNKVVIEELIPANMTLGEVQKVLQNLLRERVSIRDLGTILETLADWSPRTKDFDQLTELVRAALARQICKQYADETGVLYVLTFEAGLEQALRDSVQMTTNGAMLAIDPANATALVHQIQKEMDHMGEQGYSPVLLCSSQIRLPLKRITERSLPSLAILAYNEIVPRMEVRAVGSVNSLQIESAEIAA